MINLKEKTEGELKIMHYDLQVQLEVIRRSAQKEFERKVEQLSEPVRQNLQDISQELARWARATPVKLVPKDTGESSDG